MKKVLIVEDDPTLREVYALILEKEGYDIGLAENGKVAIGKLKSFKPDLILLDMLMPVMGGLDFLKRVKLRENHPKVKTIIVSNLSNPIPADELENYGVVKSIIKVNYSPTELAAVVKEYCD